MDSVNLTTLFGREYNLTKSDSLSTLTTVQYINTDYFNQLTYQTVNSVDHNRHVKLH